MIDGELSVHEKRRMRRHLQGCWGCRVRVRDIEKSIAEFCAAHNQDRQESLPPVNGPRALLRVQLASISLNAPSASVPWQWLGIAAAVCICVSVSIVMSGTGSRNPANPGASVVLPKHSLTPGVAALISQPEICAETPVHNRDVPTALQQKVFERYGLSGADTKLFEVDYLITPALGGSEDIRNLWPESYTAARWNAKTKDVLEQRMRDLVCAGKLNLVTAQRELAEDWIAAYKKYLFPETSPITQ